MESNIPLIDKAFGLSQLAGNEALLLKMINKFKTEFATVPEQVKALIKEGKTRDAQIKVHTTKGISGNLGLSAVFQCSKKLDYELKSEIIDDNTLDEFSQLMASTCNAIEEMDEGNSSTGREKESAHASDKYKTKLINKLNSHEFITESELDDWLPQISVSQAVSADIRNAIDALDYETALSLLKG